MSNSSTTTAGVEGQSPKVQKQKGMTWEQVMKLIPWTGKKESTNGK